MLFFRSEEEVQVWCRERNVAPGETLSLTQVWALSQKWYGNRLDANFHGRSLDEAQQVFRELGLTSAFWYIDRG